MVMSATSLSQDTILKSVIQELREIGDDTAAEALRYVFLMFTQDPLNHGHSEVMLTSYRAIYVNQDSIARLLNDVSLNDIRSFDLAPKD